MKNIVAALAIIGCFSCGNGNVRALKAFIFERKALPGNKLFVAYSYKNGQTVVKDSCIINSRVIPQDSIDIGVLTNGTAY